jgi:uncharacterized protein
VAQSISRLDVSDFNYGILGETAHRPWPVPSSPWLMTQTWHDLLFAHWPVPLEVVRPHVPPAFELDLFDGRAWVGIVPFRMTNVAPRLVPAVPWISAFPELNVRTYVSVAGRPGVYFFSLDAANPVAVAVARAFVHLPYFTATMTCVEHPPGIHYQSRRTDRRGAPALLEARYRPLGPPRPPVRGSLDYFLTERYCLYTADRRGTHYSLDIHHPPWPLQPAEAEFTTNTMASAAGLALPPIAPLLHFSRRQDMVGWGLTKLRTQNEELGTRKEG